MTAWRFFRLRRLIDMDVVTLTLAEGAWKVWMTPSTFDSSTSGPLFDTRKQYHPWEQTMGHCLGEGRDPGQAFRAARRKIRTARIEANR